MDEKNVFNVKHASRRRECELGKCLGAVLTEVAGLIRATTSLVSEKAKTVKLLNWQIERQNRKTEAKDTACTDGYKGHCDDRCKTSGCKKERNNCADVACDDHCADLGCAKKRGCR